MKIKWPDLKSDPYTLAIYCTSINLVGIDNDLLHCLFLWVLIMIYFLLSKVGITKLIDLFGGDEEPVADKEQSHEEEDGSLGS